MAIFMQIDGIKGEAKAKGYEGWIAVDSYSWGTSRQLYTQTGQSEDREGTLAQVADLTISKRMDVTSPALFQESVVGKSKKVLLHIAKQGAEGPEVYMEYTLTNAMVSSYSVGGSGGAGEEGRPSESIGFNFTKVEVKYTPYDDAHNAGTPVPAGFDVETGNKV